MKRRYILSFVIAGIMIAIMSAYYFMAYPNKGDVAPSFTLKDLSGKTHSLSDYRGKIVLLHFWATWCESCVGEIPELEKLHQRYDDNDLILLSILVDEPDPYSSIKNFKQYIPFSFPVLNDVDEKLASDYYIWGVPVSIIIDQSGTIVERYPYAMDWSHIDIGKWSIKD